MTDDVFEVQTLHSPPQTAFKSGDGLCVRVDGAALHDLNRWLYEHAEILGVQIHTHPTEAYHSDTDDAFPIVTERGALSIVVPDFCRRGLMCDGVAAYRLNEAAWEPIDESDLVAMIEIL